MITSEASVTCVGGTPMVASKSSIAGLRINGVNVSVGSAPLTIPLIIGSLRLNSTTQTATTITRARGHP